MESVDREADRESERRARFDAVARELMEPLRRFLARRTDSATADDVLSDTLLVCWRRLDELPAEPLPYAYGVARNALANARRSGRRQERLGAKIATIDPPSLVSAEPDPSDAEERVRDAMAALRPDEAELLRLWAWEQLGPSEIATVMDLTPNAVSIRLHRARGKLKDILRKNDPDAGHEPADEGRRS